MWNTKAMVTKPSSITFFYYIAEGRVDFRQLIKVLAEVFRVRIEMKQIGARQEAGRIGGIGPCGRELCCATWMTSFVSVATTAARYQDIALNPQKLAGQCAKLKCCLNYEVDTYVEAQKRLPSKEITLETKDATYYCFKTDILSNQVTYSTDKSVLANAVTISGRRAFQIINMNKRGEKPESLLENGSTTSQKISVDLVEQEELTRFDRSKKNKSKKKKKPQTAAQSNQNPPETKAQQAKQQQPKQDKPQQPKPDNKPQQPKQDKPKAAAKPQSAGNKKAKRPQEKKSAPVQPANSQPVNENPTQS